MNWEEAASICEQLLVDATECKTRKSTISKIRSMHVWILDNHVCTTKMAAALGQMRAEMDKRLKHE